MRIRKAAVTAAIFSLVIGAGVAGIAAPASALSDGVSFSAEDKSSWQTNGTVWALGTSQGKVIAGGTFSQIRPPAGRTDAPRAAGALVILDAETGEPDACQLPVTLGTATPTIRAITTSADQSTVYIAGNFSSVGGVNVARIAALDVQTCTVLPFRAPLPGSTVTALAVHGDTLYAGGLFKTVGGQPRQAFAAFHSGTGALLPWTADAVRATPGPGETPLPKEMGEGRAIAVSPDGSKVVIGGDLARVNGVESHSIAIVSGADPLDGSGGAVLRAYGRHFIPDHSITKTIIDGGDGKFYIGNEGTGGGVFDGKAAFSWATGDQVWRDTCLGAVQSLAMYEGTLYSASHAHDCSGINAFGDGIRRYFMAQNPDTMQIYGWLPLANDGIGEGIGPRAIVVATGKTTGTKYLWSGGEFTTINGRAQQGLTRFGPEDTGLPPTPAVSAQATSDGTVQVRFRTVVDADDSDLTYDVYRGNETTPIWSGVSRSLWWERPQVTFVDAAVTPGSTYTYRVTASDGTNTSPRSAASSATVRAAAADYAATVRSDAPQSYWTGSASGTWAHDSAAAQTRVDAVPAALMDGATVAPETAVAGSAGSYSFDGVNDYAVTDQLRPGPSTYSVETWINTTTTAGGKIVGFGNGRPRTGSNAPNPSGNYDRHVYMREDGRVHFGVYANGTVNLTSPEPLNDGEWHHIVATQGPAGMALYIDGLRVSMNSTTQAQSYWGVWRLGGDNLNGWPDRPGTDGNPERDHFAGLIDEVAVYSSALAPSRIAAHYLSSGRELDLNEAPTDAYGAAVFAADPTLYWRFDDTDTAAADSSMFGTSPGQYNTGASTQPAGAVSGSGSVTVPGNESGTVGMPQQTSPSATMTGEIWFRTDSTAGGKLFGFENTLTGNGGNYDKHLYMTNEGRLVWGSWLGYSAVVESSQSFNDGDWHHAVGILDGSGRRLYVDGVLTASSNVSGSENGSGRWRVGGGNIGGWPGQPSSFYIDGDLDEFAIYATALDDQTITRHYALGVADSTAPSVPAGLTAAASGDGVRLSWTASTDDHAVASYTLYRGATPDFAVSEDTRVGTSATTTFLDDARIPGTRYYRVVAVDGAGNVSAATDTVSVEYVDVTAPAAPEAPTATAGPDGVSLTWPETTDDVGVTGYRVHRGSTAGFVASSANQIGTSATTAYTDAAPAPGRYHYRVVAVDAAGNAGAASPSTAITVAAPDTTAPSAPTDATATLSGSTVQVRWTASTDDTAVTGYTVHRGADAAFEPSDANRIAEVTDPRYDDEGLAAGVHHYKIVAVDAAGNRSTAASAAVTIESAEPVIVTVPISEDAMVVQAAPGTNYGSSNQVSSRGGSSAIETLLSAALPAAPAGTALTRVTLTVRTSTDPTAASIEATNFVVIPDSWNEGTVSWSTRPTTPGQQLGQLAQAPTTNTAFSVDLSAAALRAQLGSTATIRMTGAGADNLRLWSTEAPNTTYRPALVLEFTPLGGPDTMPPSSPTALQASATGSSVSLGWTAATDDRGVARYDVHRSTAAGFAVSDATRVSETTAVTAQDGPLAPGTYFYRVVARDAAGNAGAASGEVAVTIATPDTSAPSAPAAPAVTVTGATAQLSWAPSTDDVAVTGYEVHRGATAGFAPTAATRVATPTATTHADGPLAAGTFWYRVVAKDAAGNASAASAATSATVVAPARTVTTTVAVDADAAGYANAPTQNYGTNNQLVSRGDVGQQSFLRLTLPTLPAGATLVSATMGLRTSTDPTAASTGVHEFSLMAGTWDEATLTWNNRPTALLGAPVLGSLAGAPATNTAYTAPLAVDQLSPLLGQSITMRLGTTSSDNLRIFSREATNQAYRPVLTLTYTLP